MYAKRWMLLVLVGFCSGCSRESDKARLEQKLISVRAELEDSRRDVETLLEIGQLMDSIDRNRFDVLVDWRMGRTPFNKYKYRLRAINRYVADTEKKIQYLQEKIDRMGGPSPEGKQLIVQLRKRIGLRNQEVVRLKAQLLKYSQENLLLYSRVNQQQATADQNEIRIHEQEGQLQALMERIAAAREAYEAIEAENCYSKAMALEKLAERTHFAASRKREALEQALMFYRQALEFGNEDARSKIQELEAKLE